MNKLDKKIEAFFIIFLIVVGIYYMYLASITPMLGEDEDTYFSLAKDFSNFRYEPFDYLGNVGRGIVPPFMPLFFSFFFIILGPSLSIAKTLIAFFSLLTLLLVYLIGKKFNIYFGFFSAVILLSITLFSHTSMLAYAETIMAFFSALFIYMLFNIENKKITIQALVIGFLFGFSFFAKHSTLILLLSFFFYCLILFFYKKDKKYLKFFFIASIAFLIIVVPYIARNLLIYKYPYFEVLEKFFEQPKEDAPPKWVTDAFKLVSPSSISLSSYISTFGIITFLLTVFGVSWFLSNFKDDLKESHLLLIVFLPTLVFLIVFNFSNVTGYIITESRYLSIIFPQMSILSGFFLWKIKDKNKYFLILILPIIVFAAFSGITTAQATSSSQRYSDNYIEALKWIKDKTPTEAYIFTAYAGSVDYFAERKNIWVIDEFPDIMHSNDATYIYETLKKYNVSYVLIWRGIVAQDFIVPESNLMGVFTYNFVNTLSNDKEKFDIAFQNQDNIIFKLK